MNKKQAEKLAKQAIEIVTVGNPEPVAEQTVLLKNADGSYCVVDNGEQVDNLDKTSAIRIMVENLTEYLDGED